MIKCKLLSKDWILVSDWFAHSCFLECFTPHLFSSLPQAPRPKWLGQITRVAIMTATMAAILVRFLRHGPRDDRDHKCGHSQILGDKALCTSSLGTPLCSDRSLLS